MKAERVARVRTVAVCLLLTALAFAPLAYGSVGADARLVWLVGSALTTALVLALRLPRESATIVAPAAGVFAGWLTLTLIGAVRGAPITLWLLMLVDVGILDGMGATRASGLRGGIRLAGSVAAFLVPAALPIAGPNAILAGAIFTLHVGALAGIEWPRRGALRSWWPSPAMFAATCLVIAAGGRAFDGWPVHELVVIPVASALIFGAGRFVAAWLSPRVRVLTELLEYLRAMWIPLGGFVIGYLFLIVIFAGIYAALHRLDPGGAFVGVTTSNTIDWLLFSVATATTLGDPVVHATSVPARAVVGLEAVIATCWLIVVFAAVTSHMGPLLARIAEQRAVPRPPPDHGA